MLRGARGVENDGGDEIELPDQINTGVMGCCIAAQIAGIVAMVGSGKLADSLKSLPEPDEGEIKLSLALDQAAVVAVEQLVHL